MRALAGVVGALRPSLLLSNASALGRRTLSSSATPITSTVTSTQLPQFSYHFDPPRGGEENSSRFHSHVDGPSHQHVRDIVSRIHQGVPSAQTKIYPIAELWLGPQTKRGEYGRTYASMHNFHPVKPGSNEAFATGRFGERMDYAAMGAALRAGELAAKQYGPGFMVEVEEELFASETDAKGRSTIQYDFPPTASAPIDMKNIWLDGYAPINPLPKYELHHGFDIPKSSTSVSRGPILCSDLIDAVTKEGFDNGGWFIFAKRDCFAYRTNEFSDKSYEECRKELLRQQAVLRKILQDRFKQSGFIQSCSLEKVLAIWRF